MKLFLVGLLFLSQSVFAKKGSSSSGGHYIFGGSDIRTVATFTEGSVSSDTATKFDTEMVFDTGSSFGYEYRNTKSNDWGFALGVKKYSKREVTEITINSTTTAIVDDPASIEVTSYYFNGIYKWNSFFMPVGISFSNIEYNTPKAYTGEAKSDAGAGFNFGIGWEIGSRFVIEYSGHSVLWDLEATDGGVTTDYGTGALAFATLSLKFKLF